MPATFAGRFLLEDAASEGEPTFVWRARELATQNAVALRFFPREWVEHQEALASARELVAEFRRLRHPGVVPTVDLVVGEPWAAFVSPWIEGPTLGQMRLARPTRMFEAGELRPWLRSLVAALEAVHAHGFVHGGLEPAVVIQQGAELRLLQVGVAAWLERAAARHQVRMRRGTDWPYRSPARRRGEPARAADDVYSLGAVAYELITGSCPEPGGGWSAPSRPRGMQRQRRRTGHRGGDIPLAWERAVLRCLEPLERDRLGSVRDFRIRLDLEAPTPAPPPAPRPAPTRPGPRTPVPPRVAPARPPPPQPALEEAVPSGDAGLLWLRGVLSIVLLVTLAVGGLFVWKLVERRRQSLEPMPGFEIARAPEPVSPPARPEAVEPDAPATVSVPAERRAPEPKPDPVSQRADAEEATNAAKEFPAAPPETPVRVAPPPASEPVVPRSRSEPEPPAPEIAMTDTTPRRLPPSPAREDGPGAASTPEPLTAALVPPSLPLPDSFPEIAPPAQPEGSAEPAPKPSDAPPPGPDEGRFALSDPPPTATSPATEPAREPEPPAPVQSVTKPAIPAPAAQDATTAVADGAVDTMIDTPAPEGIFELAYVDEAPRLLSRVDPDVPVRARRRGGPQRVELIVVVDRNGSVASAQVRTATEEALVRPTLEAVRAWRFRPAMKDGLNVAVRVALPVIFPES